MCLFAAVFALTMQAEAETLHPAFFFYVTFFTKSCTKCTQHHNLITVLRGRSLTRSFSWLHLKATLTRWIFDRRQNTTWMYTPVDFSIDTQSFPAVLCQSLLICFSNAHLHMPLAYGVQGVPGPTVVPLFFSPVSYTGTSARIKSVHCHAQPNPLFLQKISDAQAESDLSLLMSRIRELTMRELCGAPQITAWSGQTQPGCDVALEKDCPS